MSHFTFSRSLYDDCSIVKKDTESVGPFQWVTDKNVIEQSNSVNCYTPFLPNPFNSIPKENIDIESDLRGQTRPLSKCPSAKYQKSELAKLPQLEDCNNTSQLTPEYTRMNKSCNIFSGMSINRFHPLCDDVQDINSIPSNSIIGKNTRLQVKDAFNKDKK